VHYQPGAEDFARDAAALLPGAIARAEAVHGRRFACPVTVGVYATPEAYAAANRSFPGASRSSAGSTCRPGCSCRDASAFPRF
jgi:hypothetical protein